MKCIFLTVFHQTEYIKLANLLIESIFIYGNLDTDTHILVYTSTPFMEMMKQSHLYTPYKIKFEINDTYDTIDKACKARLDLFTLPNINQYQKILYLDTDIIVKDDLNKVFDVCNQDVLYVLKEGSITDSRDFWGKSLFGTEIDDYEDKTAFSSGIMLFNNCDSIKILFEKIVDHIHRVKHYFHDQPYIVYNAFKYNLYDNNVLTLLCVNDDENVDSDKVIHHFPGGPGVYRHKLVKMSTFMQKLKDNTINKNINKAKSYINEYLMKIIEMCDEKLEGNIFMLHHTHTYTDIFINKAKNISNLVLNRNIINVMEIGFNAGFSTLLMLISNPNLHITCFDLGCHKYTRPCYEKLKETFKDRIHIIYGDSTQTLKNVHDEYDLIHIDGGHSIQVATSDIQNSYRLSKNRTILIMDDYDFPHLHKLWDEFVKLYKLQPLQIHLYNSPHHDVKYIHK